MNRKILHKTIQDFILKNLDCNIHDLILKFKDLDGIPMASIAEQIEAKRKIRKKLPTWFNQSGIYYPNKKRLEQTSSERTAKYKSSLCKDGIIADITGGFGVDAFYFSMVCGQLIYCEIIPDLAEIAAHNFKALGRENIEVINDSGISYLQSSNKIFDCIYIDPSRRHEQKGRVHYIKDCEPDITQYLDLLFDSSSKILVKFSPMLDLKQAITDLEHVSCIHIIAVRNEVKELLFELRKGFDGHLKVKTMNFSSKAPQSFEFNFYDEAECSSKIGSVQSYIYEPNASILKSGGFKIIGQAFNLTKLHQHSHLYTSDEKIEFPGRVFKVEKIIPFREKNELKKVIFNKKGNISFRNFPSSTESVKKKFKIRDGGDTFLFFTTDHLSEKIVIIGSKA